MMTDGFLYNDNMMIYDEFSQPYVGDSISFVVDNYQLRGRHHNAEMRPT